MFGAMGSSDQGMRNRLQTILRGLDSELELWLPYDPVGSEMASGKLRSEIVEWLVTLNKKFDFSLDTLFLSVNIFDRFLRRVKAQTKYLRCIAVTCLYLAAKVCEEDEVIPLTWDVVRRSECGCSEAEVLRMERCILVKLDWNLKSSPTSYEFIHLFYALVLDKCPKQLIPASSHIVHQILDQMLVGCMHHAHFITYSPSIIALATLSLYLKVTWDYWLPATQALQAFAQLNDDELSDCRALISRSLGAKLIDILRSNTMSHLKESTSINQHSAKTFIIIEREDSCWNSSTQTKTPLPPSLPVTPHPPAKRRKVEQDDDVYDDIRTLYASEESASHGVSSSVIDCLDVGMMSSAVVLSSCACQAQRVSGVMHCVRLLAES